MEGRGGKVGGGLRVRNVRTHARARARARLLNLILHRLLGREPDPARTAFLRCRW